MTNINIDKRKQALFEAIELIVSDPNMIEIPIAGDDKFYLAKTSYRIEIRSKESHAWLTYIIRPSAGDTSYKDALAIKYIDLVLQSNPEHFDRDTDE